MRVLIIGKNSYIGTSVARRLAAAGITADTADALSDEWQNADYSLYDSVFHCAALVHRREDSFSREDYFKANTELPVQVAELSKAAGVKQFVFMSTMAVFGQEGQLGKTVTITADSPIDPKTKYAESKAEAERQLGQLAGDNCKLCILRPPMIYGEGCPGNYGQLKSFVLKYKMFPSIKNERSMLRIDLLCDFVLGCIAEQRSGVFHPQNPEYVCTLEMAKEIAAQNSAKLRVLPLLNPAVKLLGLFSPAPHKVWGGLVYAREIDKQ